MKSIFTMTVALATLTFASCAEAGSADAQLNTPNRAEIESVIKSYLLENPEIIRDAMIELEKKEDRAMLAAFNDALKHDKRDASYGPKDAKVTIVEFFDYNCGYCKKSTEWIKTILEVYPNDVRVVFKELPILDGRTKTSRSAAIAALAAGRQGKYKEMHFALMNERGLSTEKIETLAAANGIDVETLRKDIKDPKLAKQIDDTIELAQNLPPLTGTPFFVINDAYIAGADTDALDRLLKEALEG